MNSDEIHERYYATCPCEPSEPDVVDWVGIIDTAYHHQRDRARDAEGRIEFMGKKLAEKEDVIVRLEESLSRMTELRNGCLMKLEEHHDNLQDARVALRAVWACWTQGADLSAAVALVKGSLQPAQEAHE